jgi:hypothetical protein
LHQRSIGERTLKPLLEKKTADMVKKYLKKLVEESVKPKKENKWHITKAFQ